MQPRNNDDQTRIPPQVQGRVQSVEAHLTPYKGIVTVTGLNNSVGVNLRTISFRVEIIKPTTEEVVYDFTQNRKVILSPGETLSEQFNLGFYKPLILKEIYKVKGTFTYHVSTTEEYPIASPSIIEWATVAPRLP